MPSALFVTFGYNFSINMTELEELLKAFIPQESRYVPTKAQHLKSKKVLVFQTLHVEPET